MRCVRLVAWCDCVLSSFSSGDRNGSKKSRKNPLLPRTTLRTSSCTSVLNTMGRTPSCLATRSILRTASIALSTVEINGTVTWLNSMPSN